MMGHRSNNDLGIHVVHESAGFADIPFEVVPVGHSADEIVRQLLTTHGDARDEIPAQAIRSIWNSDKLG